MVTFLVQVPSPRLFLLQFVPLSVRLLSCFTTFVKRERVFTLVALDTTESRYGGNNVETYSVSKKRGRSTVRVDVKSFSSARTTF